MRTEFVNLQKNRGGYQVFMVSDALADVKGPFKRHSVDSEIRQQVGAMIDESILVEVTIGDEEPRTLTVSPNQRRPNIAA